MPNEISTEVKSNDLVAIIIDAEQNAESLRKQVAKFELVADEARAKVLQMFQAKKIKTIKLASGLQVTAATRETMKITDEVGLIGQLDELNVSGVLTETIPEHKAVKSAMFKTWLKEKSREFVESLPGIEFKRTDYLVIKKEK